MSDLFFKLMKLTNQKENFLTECFVATLKEDITFTRDFLIYICGDNVDGVNISNSSIKIETQVSFPKLHSCIDMVFYVGENLSIGIENKLDSPESKGQLIKYLSLPLSRIAFLTAYDTAIENSVDEHPNYLKPKNGRKHFIWSDFYEIVDVSSKRVSATVLNKALLNMFSDLGFDPPKPEIGDLHNINPEIADKNRRNFAKLWSKTRNELEKKNCKLEAASIVELYVKCVSNNVLETIWLVPIKGNLKVRLNLKDNINLTTIIDKLNSSSFPFYKMIQVYQQNVRRTKRIDTVIDITISLKKLLSDIYDTDSMSNRLAEYVLTIFNEVSV